jgi:Family of unknown function (DUF6527)
MTPRLSEISPEFVDLIPKVLEPGKFYVSMTYATTQHLCACGCGVKVVLPLSPAEWNLQYDGESVSMTPSVGNWEYECMSHYWIDHNQIRWAKGWTRSQIEAGRKSDLADLDRYFAERDSTKSAMPSARTPRVHRLGAGPRRWVRRLREWRSQ